MRMRRKKDIMTVLERAADIVLPNPADYRGRWQQVFGNPNPLHLELGTGKGAFISAISRTNPGINYVGVERVPEIIYAAAQKVKAGGGNNVRLVMLDAELLPFCFEPGKIARIYLNFSDPWPKARHEKRRLTHPRFLQLYQSILAADGEIHLKTDNLDFFEYSLSTLAGEGFSLREVTYDLHHSCFEGNVVTEYESKFSALGQPIYRLEARRVI